MKSQQQQQYQEKRTIHFAISSSNKNRNSKRIKKQMNIVIVIILIFLVILICLFILLLFQYNNVSINNNNNNAYEYVYDSESSSNTITVEQKHQQQQSISQTSDTTLRKTLEDKERKNYDIIKLLFHTNNNTSQWPILEHEDLFHKTVKQCIPYNDDDDDVANTDNSDNREMKYHKNKINNIKMKQKCAEYIPIDIETKQHIQRIALIAIPGEMTNIISNHIRIMINEYNNNNINNNTIKSSSSISPPPRIQFVQTSHIPPYGYGKTHGLTKIIRIVSQPIYIQVFDTLYTLLQNKTTTTDHDSSSITAKTSITIDDIKAGLQLILRYHCRLSHIAAHTATYTISFQDYWNHPQRILHKLQKFIQHDSITSSSFQSNNDNNHNNDWWNKIHNNISRSYHKDADNINNNDNNNIMNPNDLFNMYLSKLSLLGYNKKYELLLQQMDIILQNEIQISNHFTKWPSEAFWKVIEEYDSNRSTTTATTTLLSPIIRQLTTLLSPDCYNDPYITCFVKRDICEAKGDAICKS